MVMLHDCMTMHIVAQLDYICYELHDNKKMVKCGSVHGKAACLKRYGTVCMTTACEKLCGKGTTMDDVNEYLLHTDA